MKVSIGKAAKELGVSAETLRRWEAAGKIQVERTRGGHRRYDLAMLRRLVSRPPQPQDRITIAYARVSSHDQKADLDRQVALLEAFCAANGWRYEVIRDLGNYHKRGLQELICRICTGQVDRLVIAHKDRLPRFESELVFSLCEHVGTEVVIVNASEEAADAIGPEDAPGSG